MAHYATLRDYRFEGDVDDIRGATLYGEGGQKLARIDDIVLNHDTGDIRYFVADCGHDRKVLVPLDRVFRSVTDEDSFSSDLTAADFDHLPAFDEKMLGDRDQWDHYEKLHHTAMDDIRRRSEQEYKRGWEASPVQHMDEDVAHNITPVEPAPARAREKVTPIDRPRASNDYTPDLTPQRLAPVFTSTAPNAGKLNMVPQAGSSRGPGAGYSAIELEPRWQGFAQRVRSELEGIRGHCDTCSERDRRVA